MPKTIIHKSTFDGKTYDFVVQYKLEFLQFPFSEHDDILDCHAQLFDGEFIHKGEGTSKPKTGEDEFMWWRKQVIDKKKGIRTKPFVLGSKGIKRPSKIPHTISFR
jgi:hypothetical protein